MPELKDPQPYWRLPAAGIATIIGVTIGLVMHVSGKTDKAEHEELKKQVTGLDKNQALSAQNIDSIAKGIDRMEAMMLEINKNQYLILHKMGERQENSIGPQPNPLNR